MYLVFSEYFNTNLLKKHNINIKYRKITLFPLYFFNLNQMKELRVFRRRLIAHGKKKEVYKNLHFSFSGAHIFYGAYGSLCA